MAVCVLEVTADHVAPEESEESKEEVGKQYALWCPFAVDYHIRHTVTKPLCNVVCLSFLSELVDGPYCQMRVCSSSLQLPLQQRWQNCLKALEKSKNMIVIVLPLFSRWESE